MTDKARRSVSLPRDIEDRVFLLRQQEEFCRLSYSEIVRRLIVAGLKAVESESA